MHKESMRPARLARRLDISLCTVSATGRRGAGGQEAVEAVVPRIRSCTIGKLSGLGLCLEALVNSISLGRYMILTIHNRELILSKILSPAVVFGSAPPEHQRENVTVIG